LRDVRPRPYLYFSCVSFFLLGGCFVTSLLIVAERDPQTSIITLLLSDGRTIELSRMTPRPEELAREIQGHVARSRVLG